MLPSRIFLGTLCLILALASTLHADVVDRCVAVVNNDIITLSEVNELGKPLFQRIAEQVPSDQLAEALRQARRTVINKLIERKLLAQEAKKLHITVTDEEVNKALARILEQNHTSKEQFKKELAAIGMDEKHYREDLRDQILGSKVVNYEVRSKIIIPEEKIIDYYDTHYTEHVGKGGYYILQIGISWDKEGISKQEARKKAERIRSLAVSGKDFKELARKYSDLPSSVDGGDIGVFKKDDMAPYMRKAVTSLKPGQVSEVVETPAGYQIFKLLSSQEGQIITKVPYKDVKEEIRDTLYKQEMQKVYKKWMKKMRDQAYIKIL
ncbi:MAG TPA: peptidylprolyl isomerase [Desulfobulbus sp.]|nr:peptidylprolyl isomerase [Desulfobulbus sp.]